MLVVNVLVDKFFFGSLENRLCLIVDFTGVAIFKVVFVGPSYFSVHYRFQN